uniref:15-oxoprostaglandin 13-reductase n=1 Tax=Eptatretus burgeri TaxID=7764 RepID=A0A8C4Q5E2_EPTBU
MDVQAVLLHSRPGKDAEPTEDNFELSVHKLPSVLATGWVMVRTLCLSVDPYMVRKTR